MQIALAQRMECILQLRIPLFRQDAPGTALARPPLPPGTSIALTACRQTKCRATERGTSPAGDEHDKENPQMQSASLSAATDGLPSDADSLSRRALGAASWGAILAGAAAAAALSLILLFLGTGLGLSSVSPWANEGVSATTFSVSTIVWICFTQLIASGMGGYLTGRLRVRWPHVDADEVYFRDTAHGLLTWAVATLATAALLGSIIGAILGGGAQAGATMAGGVAHGAAPMAIAMGRDAGGPPGGGDRDSVGYFVDSLFRPAAQPAPAPAAADGAAAPQQADAEPMTATSRAEVARIVMHTLHTGPLAPQDLTYVSQVVAARTGISQQEAEDRVRTVYGAAQAKWEEAKTTAQAAADEARKASAKAALWMFISLLAGAFIASLMATFGGRLRDRH